MKEAGKNFCENAHCMGILLSRNEEECTVAYRILVTVPFTESQRKAIQAAAPQCVFDYVDPQGISDGKALPQEIVLGSLPLSIVRDMPNLKWLQLNSAGVDGYWQKGALPEGVLLTCATGAYGPSVAEHAFAMLNTLMKKMHRYRDSQLKSEWKDAGPVGSLDGSTVLILGLGDIGGYFAGMTKPLGAYNIGVRRTAGPKPDCVEEVHTMDALDDLLPRADVVFMALPNTPQTAGLMHKGRLASMKQSAILLNVGRGNAIDTDALCDAVEQGCIYSAGLDVTDPEPLPADHRMWSIQDILITPHVSGGFHIPKTLQLICDIFANNLKAYIEGHPLRNVVSAETGYADNRKG